MCILYIYNYIYKRLCDAGPIYNLQRIQRDMQTGAYRHAERQTDRHPSIASTHLDRKQFFKVDTAKRDRAMEGNILTSQ